MIKRGNCPLGEHEETITRGESVDGTAGRRDPHYQSLVVAETGILGREHAHLFVKRETERRGMDHSREAVEPIQDGSLQNADHEHGKGT